MHDDKFTFGQQQNPLVDWEENLWGFRYTALTPWNYASLSSAQVGVAMKGPIKINEKQYADYDVRRIRRRQLSTRRSRAPTSR